MSGTMEDPICLECIGNVHLRARLAADAVAAVCEECGETGPAIELAALAEQIHEGFEPHFEPTAYEQNPDAWEIFTEIAGIGDGLAQRIEEHLREVHEELASLHDTQNLYDYSTGFARSRTPMFWQDQRWDRFCASLRATARFINPDALTWLDDVFAELDSHRTYDAKGVIREICPGDPDAHFYRGRVAPREADLHTILVQPVIQIGPLPPGQGQAGRLNAAGISVFYGAIDVTTCISEIRPPVGAHVVVARFDVLRPLRLLDCEALDRLAVQASPFDPDFVKKRDRAHFLRTFSDQIARPVLPGDETLGYVPTQVVAEYLAQRLAPPIDGILYKSTQRGLARGNVMLFNRSARVEPFPHHSHYIEAWIREIDVDAEDFDNGIMLSVKEIGAVSPPEPLDLLDGPPRPVPVDPLPDTFVQQDFDDERQLTLRLASDSIAVHFIRAATFDPPERDVRITSRWPGPDD
jgi:hypothetical protein